uniref:WAT1-related protein n=1 Tax=Davidia involucrata TaxID=16924 RepID=A0A5B7A4V8_DAVIN
MIVFYNCCFVTIQSAVIVSLIAERDPSSWRLKSDMVLIAISYIAVVGTVFRFSVATWCLGRRGPLYVSMFKPLAVVVAVGLGVIFVGDALYLGRYGFIYMLLNLFYKFKLKITANEVIMITWTDRDEPQKKKN